MSLQVYDEKSQQAAAEAVAALQNNAPRVERTPYTPSRLDYFCAAALQGILANQNYEPPRRRKIDGMAEDALSVAKALIAAIDSSKTE